MYKEDYIELMKEIIKRHHDADFDAIRDAAMAERARSLDRKLFTGDMLDPEDISLLDDVKKKAEERFWRLDRQGLAVEFKRECDYMAEMISKDDALPKELRQKAPPGLRALNISNPQIAAWAIMEFRNIEKDIADLEQQRLKEYDFSRDYKLREHAEALREVLNQLVRVIRIIARYKSLAA